MSHYISEHIKQLVRKRAKNCCEYCRLNQADSFMPFEVDHILSLRHDGTTVSANLALSCPTCNRFKAADIGTFLDGNLRFVRLFHPRKDSWDDHFEVNKGEIVPLTRIGRATVKLLNLNDPDRIILRQVLIAVGRYP